MNRLLLVIIIFLTSFVVTAQEKRLALVIGNGNYDNGPLKNPVNDALLIAKTLDSLNFDVILDTNISNRRDFLNTISNFGNKRPNYDVAFVYYAGHGVQVNNENYLLPTQEEFKSEDDIIDYGVSVQRVIKYLTSMTDQVNVLILDACRDNPFESNWGATRSLAGSGLAKMQAPSGSLIAFSTTAGKTAPDGQGENSVYCSVLAKNMLLEGVNLDQVFRNVRAEVKQLTSGKQLTEESTQLTGETFYLVQNTFTDELKQIDDLIDDEKYTEALVLAGHIVELSPKNKIAHYSKGRAYYYLYKYENALLSLDKAFALDSNYVSAYSQRGLIYAEQNKYDLAIKEYERGIALAEIDPSGAAYCYRNRATQYERLREYDKAEADYTSAIALEPENADRYFNRAIFYEEYLKDYDLALLDYTKAIELDEDEPDNWYNRGRLYYYQSNNGKALKDFEKVLEIDSTYVNAINYRGVIFNNEGKYDLAIKEYERGIALAEIDPSGAAYCYSNRATQYERLREYDKAEADYTSAIALEPENADRYLARAFFYEEYLKDYDLALLDHTKAIELDEDEPDNWYNRGRLYYYQSNNEKSLKDFEKVLEIDSTYVNAINYRGVIFNNEGKYDLAIKEYERGIALAEIDPSGAAYCYSNRATQYERLREYDKAEADYTSAIALEPENADRYNDRANFYYEYLEDYDLALLDYTKAIELDEDEPGNVGQ